MASMFKERATPLSLIDAGAGVGSLSAAYMVQACGWKNKPSEVTVTAYEIEPVLIEYLQRTLDECKDACGQSGVKFEYEIIRRDFIAASVALLKDRALLGMPRKFNSAIVNPPYQKIKSSSDTRKLLRSVGIEASNLYTAFLSLLVRMLEPDGELVAIVPRSFCNGPYFRSFRLSFLKLMTIRRVHLFESREQAFQEDNVLQENVILYAVKATSPSGKVLVSSSAGPDDEDVTIREIAHEELVHPDDPDGFIHIIPDELGNQFKRKMDELKIPLEKLGMKISTGRVVDFRAKELLRKAHEKRVFPLIYPAHFSNGYILWPGKARVKPKFNALAAVPEADDVLVPAGFYVLVRRFSAKEERRRVVAAVYSPDLVRAKRVGFENHLNYYHRNGGGLPRDLAKGLAAFLNSTLLDQYFRQFSGHTQVNATDLRSIKYPSTDILRSLGTKIGDAFPSQDELDRIVMEELNLMSTNSGRESLDPIKAKQKIKEALEILQALSLPRAQRNDRSALTLLALLDLKPNDPWSKASAPLRGITEMMDYFRDHYGKTYAPNTRETVRRQTIHQFLQEGLVQINPDAPKAINSPKTTYRIDVTALDLLRTYGTANWATSLKSFLETAQNLQRLSVKERQMTLIPVTLLDGRRVRLSGGGQNALIKKVLEGFCPRFTPGGTIVSIGDAGEKLKIDWPTYLKELGVSIDKHGKMPDVVVHFKEKNWLVLIEAVTSHGPIDIKRHNELKELFGTSSAGLVFVTAFETRKDMSKFLSQIAWETDVWTADSPTHLVHFNGERFLGPYEDSGIKTRSLT